MKTPKNLLLIFFTGILFHAAIASATFLTGPFSSDNRDLMWPAVDSEQTDDGMLFFMGGFAKTPVLSPLGSGMGGFDSTAGVLDIQGSSAPGSVQDGTGEGSENNGDASEGGTSENPGDGAPAPDSGSGGEWRADAQSHEGSSPDESEGGGTSQEPTPYGVSQEGGASQNPDGSWGGTSTSSNGGSSQDGGYAGEIETPDIAPMDAVILFSEPEATPTVPTPEPESLLLLGLGLLFLSLAAHFRKAGRRFSRSPGKPS